MAISNISIAQISGANLFVDDDNQNAAVAVKASSAVIYQLELDNTANGADTYCKIFNVAAGSVVIGTTAPDLTMLVPAATKITLVFPNGLTFGTALSVASVTTKVESGSTSPVSSFIVKMVYV